MDVLLWLGWAFALVVMVFTIWMLLAGMIAARSPSWDTVMYAAGIDELRARGYRGPTFSIAEASLINDILGPEPEPIDDMADARLIDAIHALTDATEGDFDRLSQLRDEVLRRAVSRQHATVARVTAPWLFVKIWKVRRRISSLHVAAVGLRWFVPLFVARTRRIGETYLTTAAFVGVWLGLLYWWFTRAGEGDTGDWVAAVGVVVTLASGIGLVAAMGKQMSSVALAWWGPPSGWTLKGVLSAITATITVTLLLVLIMTGMLQRAKSAVGAWLLAELDKFDASEAVGTAFMLAFVVHMIYGAITLARARHLKTTDRLTMGATAIFWTAFSAVIVSFMFNVPEPWLTASHYAFVVTLLCVGVLMGVISTFEWIGDYRSLRRDGVSVPRRGFRPWALSAWIATAVIVTVSFAVIPTNALNESMSPLGQIVGLFLVGVELILAVTFWPGVIITALYARRVSKYAAATAHRRQVSLAEPLTVP